VPVVVVVVLTRPPERLLTVSVCAPVQLTWNWTTPTALCVFAVFGSTSTLTDTDDAAPLLALNVMLALPGPSAGRRRRQADGTWPLTSSGPELAVSAARAGAWLTAASARATARGRATEVIIAAPASR